MLPWHSVDSEHTTHKINSYDLLINISSMECPHEAPAHRAVVGGVQGGEGGFGAAHHAQVIRHIVFTSFF